MQHKMEKSEGGATEYALMILPRGSVAERIFEERKEFEALFHANKPMLQKPFIMLSKFEAREEMEETLVRWLQKIIGQEQSFSLTLNNYSAVQPDTICMRLQDHAIFFYLLKKLEVLKQYIPVASGFFKRPYLEFAGQLPLEIFEKAIPHYSRKTFHEEFVVNELVLTKRENSFDHFKTIQVFGLLPQSDLFNRVA